MRAHCSFNKCFIFLFCLLIIKFSIVKFLKFLNETKRIKAEAFSFVVVLHRECYSATLGER